VQGVGDEDFDLLIAITGRTNTAIARADTIRVFASVAGREEGDAEYIKKAEKQGFELWHALLLGVVVQDLIMKIHHILAKMSIPNNRPTSLVFRFSLRKWLN